MPDLRKSKMFWWLRVDVMSWDEISAMLHDRQAAWLLVFWCLFWFWGLLYLVVAVIRLIEGPDAMGWALADIPVSTARAVMYGTFTVYLVVVRADRIQVLGK